MSLSGIDASRIKAAGIPAAIASMHSPSNRLFRNTSPLDTFALNLRHNNCCLFLSRSNATAAQTKVNAPLHSRQSRRWRNTASASEHLDAGCSTAASIASADGHISCVIVIAELAHRPLCPDVDLIDIVYRLSQKRADNFA